MIVCFFGWGFFLVEMQLALSVPRCLFHIAPPFAFTIALILLLGFLWVFIWGCTAILVGVDAMLVAAGHHTTMDGPQYEIQTSMEEGENDLERYGDSADISTTTSSASPVPEFL